MYLLLLLFSSFFFLLSVLFIFLGLVFSTCILDKLVIFSLKKRSLLQCDFRQVYFYAFSAHLSHLSSPHLTSDVFCYLGFLPNTLTGSYKKKETFEMQNERSHSGRKLIIHTLYILLCIFLCVEWNGQVKHSCQVFLFHFLKIFFSIAFLLKKKTKTTTAGIGSGF